ncbi:MAG TPA: hypothetical protein VJS43_11395 [Candidatus Acidoferrales bacterium]|nr:hypothetical protein [Candidatus Acidoferrales bacterium]
MNDPAVRVLMLGEKAIAPSWLLRRLEQNACACWSTESADHAVTLFEKHKFQLILNTGPIAEAVRILPRLGKSDCSFFSAFLVEHGCWWLPMMYIGRECFGASALRTSEFLTVLDDNLQYIRTGRNPIAIEHRANTSASLAHHRCW